MNNVSVDCKQVPIITDYAQSQINFGFLGREVNCRFSEVLFRSGDGLAHPVRFLKQIHGGNVVSYNIPCGNESNLVEGDGWIVDTHLFSDFVVGIKTADCTPVVMISEDKRYASILHCGWRSVVNDIVPNAINKFKLFNIECGKIHVHIGPGAQVCCYDVGEDVLRYFQKRILMRRRRNSEIDVDSIIRSAVEKKFLSISNYLRFEMMSLGVNLDNIVLFNHCTICNSAYFSHRREKEMSGRQLSFISGFKPLEIIECVNTE